MDLLAALRLTLRISGVVFFVVFAVVSFYPAIRLIQDPKWRIAAIVGWLVFLAIDCVLVFRSGLRGVPSLDDERDDK